MPVSPTIDLEWLGPFGWPGFESTLPPVPDLPGVYLPTFEYRGGYLICFAGITRRSVRSRLQEHTKQYLSGVYTVLDVDAIQEGARREIWHGFWMKQRPSERVALFEAHRDEIIASARRQLASFRVFMTGMKQPRILERLEAAVMNHLYQQPSPYCDLPDRGMMLAPRWSTENVITVNNICAHVLHTLPPQLEI
jgi:hypothetical protein